MEPDAVLQDLAVAFYPDASELEGLSRKWLRDVVAEEPVGGVSDEDLDTACPDIDAPYEFSSTDMCARLVVDKPAQPTVETTITEGSSSSNKKSSSPDAASGGIIAVAVIASALVLLVVGGLSYYANRRLPPPAKALPADTPRVYFPANQPVVTRATETASVTKAPTKL